MRKSLTHLSDAAGTVVATGDGVTSVKDGTRVNSTLDSHWHDGAPGPDAPAYCLGMPLSGRLAEYIIIHEDSAVPAPASMRDEEAATLPIAPLTA